MKSFLKLLVGLALLTYLIYAVTKSRNAEDTSICKRVDIEVTDSSKAAFITEKEVVNILAKKRLYPKGIPINKVQAHDIEQALEENRFILDAQCYNGADDVVYIKVSQRLPVMHVLSENGSDYFIDEKGQRLTHVRFSADVVVATGVITQNYAKKYLAPLGRYLQQNEFWNQQIEQLVVKSNGTLEMVPRVGDHVVYLGSPAKIPEKLDRLKIFYNKVLCDVGWNKYSRIDMEFENQIVCTKKE